MAKKIAVLVSGGGTNLQALIDAQSRGEIVNGEIAAVISSSPKAYALERAKNANIPSCVIARKDYPSNQAMTIALTEKLRELGIDLVVLAGFMVILRGNGTHLSQRHFEYPPRSDPLFCRSWMLWSPRPREGFGVRCEAVRRYRPLRQRGV